MVSEALHDIGTHMVRYTPFGIPVPDDTFIVGVNNQDVSLILAPPDEHKLRLSQIVWSFHGVPTSAPLFVRLKNDGKLVLRFNVFNPNVLFGQLTFSPALVFPTNAKIEVVLDSAGAGVAGMIYANSWFYANEPKYD